MSNKEFKKALDLIVQEKGIDEDVVIDAMQSALSTAFKKNEKADYNSRVLIDRNTGEIKVFKVTTIVEDYNDDDDEIDPETGEVKVAHDYLNEMTISEAKEVSTEYQVGDEILEINSIETKDAPSIIEIITTNKNVKLKIKRDNNIIVMETKTEESVYYYLGIKNKLAEDNLQNNIYYAYWETIRFVSSVFENLKNLFTGNIYIEQMSGPIGISEYIAKTDNIYITKETILFNKFSIKSHSACSIGLGIFANCSSNHSFLSGNIT